MRERTDGRAVADRATRKDALYRTIGVKVVTPPYDVNTRARSLSGPVDDPELVREVAVDLLDEFDDEAAFEDAIKAGEIDLIVSRERGPLSVAVEEEVTYFSTLPSAKAALEAIEADDDPLDVLVLMQEPVVPLSVVRARPIGLLRMEDQGRTDDKIIGVHIDDPAFDGYESIRELPDHRLRELWHFFEDYKEMEGKQVHVEDFDDEGAAREAVEQAVTHYDRVIAPEREKE